MRKPTPAYVAAAVVIALAGSAAFAQTAPTPSSPSTSVAATGSRPTASAPSRSGTASAGGTVTRPMAPASGPGGFSAAPGGDLTPSGSGQTYSAVGPTPGSTSGTSTTAGGISTTETVNTDGTKTITTSGPQGWKIETFDRNGALLSTLDSRSSPFTAPVINGAPGGVSADGERLAAEERERALASDSTLVELQERAMLNSDLARSSVSLNRVIKDAEKDRRKIGRNGQLLHSIAPRTNVDRSREMPDDGPTPALSGLASGFPRR